ncbi:hypothetical protein ACI2OX_22140 [Bacillus sp. N9]
MPVAMLRLLGHTLLGCRCYKAARLQLQGCCHKVAAVAGLLLLGCCC